MQKQQDIEEEIDPLQENDHDPTTADQHRQIHLCPIIDASEDDHTVTIHLIGEEYLSHQVHPEGTAEADPH